MSLNSRRSEGVDAPVQLAFAAPTLGSAQQGAVAQIVRGVLNRCPMVALTGPSGIGKTTVLGEALGQLRGRGERVIGVSLPRSDRAQLREVARQALGRSTVRVRQPALDFLILIRTVAASRHDLRPQILVVDDAHRLLPETLEFLRRLTAWSSAEGLVWQVILSGRMSFWDTVRQKGLTDIEASIAFRCSLDRLTQAEARAIIAQHLGRPESSVQEVIADDALSLLLEAGQGIPGRLLRLLDNVRATSASHMHGGIITRDLVTGGAAGRASRPVSTQPGRKRAELPAISLWLGAGGGVLVLTIGLAAWQLAAPSGGPGSLLPAARKAAYLRPDPDTAALHPAMHAQADRIDSLPAEFTAEPRAPRPRLRVIGASVAPVADDSDGRLGGGSSSATSPGADLESLPAPPASRASVPEIPPDLAAALAEAEKLVAADAARAAASKPLAVEHQSEAAGAQTRGTMIPTADRDTHRAASESSAEQAAAQPGSPAMPPTAGLPAATTMATPPESAASGSVAGFDQPQAASASAAMSGTRAGVGAAEAPQREALAHASPAAQPASPPVIAPAAANVGAASGAARMSETMVSALIARGDALFAVGDVSGARLFYERAARGGSVRAATSVGKTYDPAFLGALKARGMQPDPKAAAEWYQTAAALGNAEASQLLQRLSTTAGVYMPAVPSGGASARGGRVADVVGAMLTSGAQ